MKRFTLLKTMLLLCALIVGSGNLWGDTVTFNYADYKGEGTTSSGSSYTMVKTDVSIGDTKFYGNNSQAHFYASGTSTITPASGVTITQIVLTATEEKYNGYQSNGTVTASAGSLAHSGVTLTWTGSATSAFTINHNKQIRWTSIVVTYTKSVSYTITAVSNNNSWGTVSGTTTITAFPADGYRVKAGDEGYTVTNGTATVTNNGDNTFSVSASKDCTVQINFEAIPTRTITVTPTSDGTITVKNGDDVVSSGSSIREGTELTISAVAGANKEFASWSVTGATPASTTDAETTFTVGENNVSIAASFNDIVTHEISWSVNGSIVKVENVKEGNELTFAAPASGTIPAGYIYKGWVVEANKIDGTTDTDPSANYVTSATSTTNITYYAVMAVDKVTSATATLTASHTINSATYGDHVYTDDKGNTWSGFNNEPYDGDPKVARYGFNSSASGGTPYFESPTFPGNVSSITIGAYNAAGSARTFNLNSSKDNNNHDLGTISISANSKTYPDVNASLGKTAFKKFYMRASAAIGFSYIKVTYGTTTTSNYCTTIPNASVIITSAKYATFCDNVTRDFSASGITVYTAESDGSKVTLTEVEDGVVPDGEGVILFCKTADTYTVPATTKDATDYDALDNELIGINERTLVKYVGEGSKKNYILSNEDAGVGFYKATTLGAYLAAHRAYLSTGAATSRSFLGFDDETTGIETINTNPETVSGVQEYYNLNGQRVTTPTKGLYIVNGKKVIINK